MQYKDIRWRRSPKDGRTRTISMEINGLSLIDINLNKINSQLTQQKKDRSCDDKICFGKRNVIKMEM